MSLLLFSAGLAGLAVIEVVAWASAIIHGKPRPKLAVFSPVLRNYPDWAISFGRVCVFTMLAGFLGMLIAGAVWFAYSTKAMRARRRGEIAPHLPSATPAPPPSPSAAPDDQTTR